MKASEIVVGRHYMTKVSGDFVRVEVTAIVEGHAGALRWERTAYRCRRVDNGKELPKPRCAQALHATRQP